MERHINTYQGMNKDMGFDSIPNTLYIDAVDIRITTTQGESMGSWTNIKGNKEAFTIDTGTNPEIIGFTTIRNKIILFVADDTSTASWIYLVEYNPSTREIVAGFPQLVYYDANLGFSKSHPIKAIGRFESGCVERVYWTDYNNFFRSINIADPNVLTTAPGLVDIFPDVIYTQPLLKNVLSGGVLFAGLYQVAFRLRTADGKETLISPPSNLVHVTAPSETIQNAQYVGSLKGTNTGKALNFIIDTTDYGDFKEMDVILIFHEDYQGTPSVRFIETKEIVGSSLEFLITGAETTIQDIEFLTYISKSHVFKTFKTLAQKDNSLVVANIKQSNFSIDDRVAELGETFDVRTVRYRNVGAVITTNDDEFNQDYNLDAHWDADWHLNKQYKYQSDGVTLGGEAPNLTYNFHLEPFVIDTDAQDGFANVGPLFETHDLNDGYDSYNTTYPNNSSPFLSGKLKGYKRGETYRMGLIVWTTKGETSFVKHVGDIKFPDISEQDAVNNLSGTNYFPLSINTSGNITTAYSLGVEFTIDFSTCPNFLAEIESYQFVRLERTNIDKRRITSGILKTTQELPIGADLGDFNLEDPNGGTDIFHLNVRNKIASTITYLNNLTAGETDPIVEDFVVYHSPEISFNFNNIPDLITSTGNTCTLITGAYVHPVGTLSPNVDLSGPETLGTTNQDYTAKLRTCINVNTPSIEHVKIWEEGKLKLNMIDSATTDTSIAGPFSAFNFYLRNYYASYDTADGAADLNNPQGGIGTVNTPEISKGGTGIAGKISAIPNDPITNAALGSFSITPGFHGITRGDAGDDDLAIPIVDTLLPKAEIYGGFTQDVLETNIFIPASPVIKKTELNPIVFGGDIFLSMFTFQSSMLELDPKFWTRSGGNPEYYDTGKSRTGVFVTESIINIDIAHGSTLKTSVKYTEAVNGSEFQVLRQENNNTYTLAGLSFNMYAHNQVYSRENKDVTFFIQPSGTGNCGSNDIRAYLSDVKINEEQIDSWTKFGANNYYDVDDYGPINEILNWKDNVFFYQDKAVGMYAINRAAITTTDDGVPTELGTGLGFGKHQYISKVNGCIHQWGVKPTEMGIYSFDAIHRKIFLMNGQNNPLSEVKGIHSFLQLLPNDLFLRKEDGGDNPILKRGITIGRDAINDEVIFTFLGSGTFVDFALSTAYTVGQIISLSSSIQGPFLIVIANFSTTADAGESLILLNANATQLTYPYTLPNFTDRSIVYDELAQQFSSRYSTIPKIWIENGDTLLSANPQNNEDLFTHNIGNWGEFYGTIQEASITLVINPNADINKVLRTLEFNSIVRDNDKVIDRSITITAFKIETETQTTGKILFSADRIKRRFDKWRVKIPRDQLSVSQRGRMRSTHFIVTLYFDNTENKEFIMNRLMSYYDVQIF